MNKKIYLYKSLQKECIFAHNNFKWKLNKWYKINGTLQMCGNGFHASENIIDAMTYVNCEVLAKVEVRGQHIQQSDKQCWSEMRIVKKWTWEKKDSVKLAIYSASLVLKNFERVFPDDKRPRLAIKALKDYLNGKDVDLSEAAWAAAGAARAARAARAAAWAADAAAWAAAGAARAVILLKCHNWVIRHLEKNK